MVLFLRRIAIFEPAISSVKQQLYLSATMARGTQIILLYLNLACLTAASAAAASLLLGEQAFQNQAEGASHCHYINYVQCLLEQD